MGITKKIFLNYFNFCQMLIEINKHSVNKIFLENVDHILCPKSCHVKRTSVLLFCKYSPSCSKFGLLMFSNVMYGFSPQTVDPKAELEDCYFTTLNFIFSSLRVDFNLIFPIARVLCFSLRNLL